MLPCTLFCYSRQHAQPWLHLPPPPQHLTPPTHTHTHTPHSSSEIHTIITGVPLFSSEEEKFANSNADDAGAGAGGDTLVDAPTASKEDFPRSQRSQRSNTQNPSPNHEWRRECMIVGDALEQSSNALKISQRGDCIVSRWRARILDDRVLLTESDRSRRRPCLCSRTARQSNQTVLRSWTRCVAAVVGRKRSLFGDSSAI